MTELAYDILPIITSTVFVVLAFGIAMAFIRLVMGPTLPDRVVALDLIAILSAGAIAVYAIHTNQPIVVLVAIVLALIMFVATVAFAMFIEKGSTE